jgi:hypothetical protein
MGMKMNLNHFEVFESLKAGTIDLTPTWVAVLPLYLAALADGSPTAQSAARSELLRMAQLADMAVPKKSAA